MPYEKAIEKESEKDERKKKTYCKCRIFSSNFFLYLLWTIKRRRIIGSDKKFRACKNRVFNFRISVCRHICMQ